MMKLRYQTACVLLSAALLGACAQSKPTTSDASAPAATRVDPSQVGTIAAQTFQNAPNLSQEQKEKLLALVGEISQNAQRIRSEIASQKAQLFQELVKDTSKEKDARAIRKRITKLYNEELALMQGAFEKAQQILGRRGPKDPNLFRPMLEVFGAGMRY